MPPTQNKSNERIRFCSQDSHFIQVGTDAERLTAAYLSGNLNPKTVGDYQILVNYNLPYSNSGGKGNLEIDILLINKFGVFAIEVKDWHGLIEAHEGSWYQLGKSEFGRKYKHNDVFSTLSHKVKILHSRLSRDFEQLNKISVIGLITLFRGRKNFKNFSHFPDDVVCGLDNDLLLGVSSSNLLHYGRDSRILTDAEIKKITDSLYNSRSEDKDEVITHYRILDQLSSGPLFESFEAMDTFFGEKQVRIKVFTIPLAATMQRLALERVTRDTKVDTRLGSHPNILKTFEFFQDTSDPYKFYEVTEPIRGERLDEIMAAYRGPIPYDIQLECLEQLCEALQHAHSKKIFHRMLSPEVIYIQEGTKIKLADFDLAKISGEEQSVFSPVDPSVVDLYADFFTDDFFAAPEVKDNPSKATNQSDIYSLGALWLSLAVHPKKVTEITERDLNLLSIPAEAIELIRNMTAGSPQNRPQTIDKILEKLRTIKKDFSTKLDIEQAR